jgi:nitric oxide reductase subunit B
MKSTRRLWIAFTLVILVSFAVLLYYGIDLYHKAPPVPARVKTTDGNILFTQQDIKDGQNVWQSIGGQEIGTVWGHGSYVAPDWTADWLHRESMYMLDKLSQQHFGSPYNNIPPDQQMQLQKLLQLEIRKNTYDENSGDITISPLRAEAIQQQAITIRDCSQTIPHWILCEMPILFRKTRSKMQLECSK